jgi:hypothetical protein
MDAETKAKIMMPLDGSVTNTRVLHIDLSVGHAVVAEEAEHRLSMLRAITNAISCTSVESFAKTDQPELCLALTHLIDEARCLYRAAYQLADKNPVRGIQQAG